MPKVTKRLVEGIKPANRDVLQWDSELRGFGVRVKSSGVRSYLVQYRNQHGRSRRLTIGTHGRLTAEEARAEARRLLADVARGCDPAEDRKALRNALTMSEFSERYMTDYAEGKKKPGTLETDRINLRCHILPALGNLPVASITKSDVVRLHQSMKDTPGAANRTIQLVSHMLNVAEKWGQRPDGSNPCRHVEKFKERKRERYLSASELLRLGEVLADAERTRTELPGAIAAIRLLIFTGCRRGEILTLRWEHVDFEKECLRLPDSKTGARTIHLNAPALEILSVVEHQDGNPYVIVGGKPGAHLVNLRKPWQRIRAQAELEDVRLHDLRHSFASVAVGLGESLHMTGKLLGHSQAQTTQRYAHLADDPVKAATERVGAAISGMMAGKTGEVVPIKGQSRT
jgi:integrase